jgi:hypothetical protein
MSRTLQRVIKTGDPRSIFKQIVNGASIASAREELVEGEKLQSVRALVRELCQITIGGCFCPASKTSPACRSGGLLQLHDF